MERRAPKAAFKNILFPIAFQFIMEPLPIHWGNTSQFKERDRSHFYRRFVGRNRRIWGPSFTRDLLSPGNTEAVDFDG
ncbi:hypothetical protein CEXT_20401 [Caerostris extrusa]|uniref:Uncharacterized protein n=1 Tax=Caerostris extrusa TaxID=172846 RepID=A0AAV4R630_CAEEX|nr:hypothetical protein CEXT_20401 [Caerostris extrusa]